MSNIRLSIYLTGSILFLILFAGCFSSHSPQSTLAQTNIDSTVKNQSNQPDIEILKGLYPLCDYNTEKGIKDFSVSSETTGERPIDKLYDLIYSGYPKEISIEEGLSIFNQAAKCNEIAKSQLPLTAEELIAAIRDWDCTKEKAADSKKFCNDAWKITETGKMPKGSFIDYSNGLGGTFFPRGKKGFEVSSYEIYLYLWLDKYRRDMRDQPIYSHTIRLQYIDSKPKEIYP